MQEVADLDRLSLRLETFRTQAEISLPWSLSELEQLWQRRLVERVPLQYLVGFAPWRHFRLRVSPAVLIPRPETECLIDLVAAAAQKMPTLPDGQPEHWADLGTGSGAIALGLASILPKATIHAVDASPAALTIARENGDRYDPDGQIQFYQGSWFAPLASLKGQLRGMVSNPPYIPGPMVPELQPEVAHHEPRLALDGGPDGLDCLRHLVNTAPEYLRSGGLWLVELMIGQAEAVVQLLQQQGSYDGFQIHKDLEGVNRFVSAYRR